MSHSSRVVVLDTSSLSSLVVTGCIQYLQCWFDYILIPQAVQSEFSAAFSTPRGVSVVTLNPVQRAQADDLGLHSGESQAVILARDRAATLVMDDNLGRKVARSLGIAVIGSVTLIKTAFVECLLDLPDYHARIYSFQQNDRARSEILAWARLARKP